MTNTTFDVARFAGKGVAYHVTPEMNLQSIRDHGLTASIGDRSEDMGEERSAVYLFPSLEDLESALGGWLGECFEEDEDLAVLEVNIDNIELQTVVD